MKGRRSKAEREGKKQRNMRSQPVEIIQRYVRVSASSANKRTKRKIQRVRYEVMSVCIYRTHAEEDGPPLLLGRGCHGSHVCGGLGLISREMLDPGQCD